MDKKILKPLLILVGLILVSVMLARGCATSETVADYAQKHSEEIANEQENNSQTQSEDALTQAAEVAKVTETAKATEAAKAEEINATEAAKAAKATEAAKAADAIKATEAVKAAEDLNRIYAEDDEGFYIENISDELLASMKGKSYADNIDESIVNASVLRHVVIKYVDFNGDEQIGEIVCNEKIAVDLLQIFEELYKADYRLESVKLIDVFDADDDASMEADNTSCFNYRVVDNTTKLSYHAYGLAIDINPFYNPYVQMRNGELYICPEASAPYADRDAEFAYKIDENDLAYRLFKQHGFIWGGDWNSCKDYQHFEKRIK